MLAAKAKFAKNARPRAALGELGNRPAALTSKVKAGNFSSFSSVFCFSLFSSNGIDCFLFFQTSVNLGVGAKSKRTLHRTEATTALLSKQEAKENDAKQQEKTIDMDVIGEALESCFSTVRPANVVDIDKEDHGNPQLCAEYAQEIYQYMHKLEVSFSIPSLAI